jgi:hypothetical protein
VFSSLDPERIQTTASTPWGVRALKQYLIFGRTGNLQQAADGGDQPTNDFERAVGDALKDSGYDVVPQMGVAGFFIDLGVRPNQDRLCSASNATVPAIIPACIVSPSR